MQFITLASPDTLAYFTEILFIAIGTILLALARFALLRLHQPTTLLLWMIKVFVSALSPLLFLVGLLIAVSGMFFHSPVVFVMGTIGALLYLIHIYAITRSPDESTGFEQAFGKDWYNRIPPSFKAGFLPARYVFRLPSGPEPQWQQNLVCHTISATGRAILCDIWQPPTGVEKSGHAFIYLHGSAWTVLDKDFGTRKFFRHLAAEGHLVMDLAHRLFPETDMKGMVEDAFHAIAWMKTHAAEYGVDPDKITIGGGSSGAHIALLAAYGHEQAQFRPADLEGTDLRVNAVISLYGQSDLSATFYHTCQHLTSRSALGKNKKGKEGGMPEWLRKGMGDSFHRLGFDKEVEPGMLVPILGGSPEEKPETYALYSPLTHVNSSCPPTLIIHGRQDILAPEEPMRQLREKLSTSGVPVVMHLLPQTDHAFDLILPRISPSAQNAWYDVERFLSIEIPSPPISAHCK